MKKIIFLILILVFVLSGCYSRNYNFKGKWGGDYSDAYSYQQSITFNPKSKRLSFKFKKPDFDCFVVMYVKNIKKIKNEESSVFLKANKNECYVNTVSFRKELTKEKFKRVEISDRKVIVENCKILLWTGSKLRFRLTIRDSGEDKQLNTNDDNVYNIETKETFKLVKDIQTLNEYLNQNMS